MRERIVLDAIKIHCVCMCMTLAKNEFKKYSFLICLRAAQNSGGKSRWVSEFETSLVCRGSSGTVSAIIQRNCLEKGKKENLP